MSKNNDNIFREFLNTNEMDFIIKISGSDVSGNPSQYNRAYIDTLWMVFSKYRKRIDSTAVAKAKNEFSSKIKSLPEYCK